MFDNYFWKYEQWHHPHKIEIKEGKRYQMDLVVYMQTFTAKDKIKRTRKKEVFLLTDTNITAEKNKRNIFIYFGHRP